MTARPARIIGVLALIACLAAPHLRAQTTPAQTSPPAPPATNPTPAPDASLLAELEALQKRLDNLRDLTTTFTQEKHTTLLRKPLVSSGRIRVIGSLMRWDTEKPAPSSMLISDDGIELYYPRQKLLEIYPVDEEIARLAASPVPRISVMREHFDFRRLRAADLDPNATDERYLALELIPRAGNIQQHIDHVRLLLDRSSAYLRQMQMLDADGDRTIIRFDDVRMNTGLSSDDLKLDIPSGTRISRPLSPETPSNPVP